MNLSINNMTNLSNIMSQGSIMSQVGAKIFTSTLDTTADAVAELTKSMELSVNPNIGGNFDISI